MSENTMLVPQMGITVEQATANCEELAKAIREITAGVLTTVNSFCRWIQQVAAEVAAQQEMETALRWASVDNRPLYNRYRHTKKSCTMRRTAFPLRACGSAAWWRKSPPLWRGGGRRMAERNDMTMAMVTAYTSPQLAAINEYLAAEKAVRAAAEILGLDADLMIAEAEGLARATTFSNVEALYFVADQAASGKREVNGHA